MMYFKFIVLCFCLLLSGCGGRPTEKTEDQTNHIDGDYGVRYVVNENVDNSLSDIVLHIDPEHEDVIVALNITVPKDIDDNHEKDADELMELYNTKMSMMKEKKCVSGKRGYS